MSADDAQQHGPDAGNEERAIDEYLHTFFGLERQDETRPADELRNGAEGEGEERPVNGDPEQDAERERVAAYVERNWPGRG